MHIIFIPKSPEGHIGESNRETEDNMKIDSNLPFFIKIAWGQGNKDRKKSVDSFVLLLLQGRRDFQCRVSEFKVLKDTMEVLWHSGE